MKRNDNTMSHLPFFHGCVMALLALLIPCLASAQYLNGDTWPDTDGRHINAYDGCVVLHEGVYYWYGESWNNDRNGGTDGVAVYSSRDLQKWKNEGLALRVAGDAAGHGCRTMSPRVLYNARTGKFTMLFHQEQQGSEGVCVVFAESDVPTGPFHPVRSESLPIDGQTAVSGMALFTDIDGRSYYIASSPENKTLVVNELSDDCLSFTDRCSRPSFGAGIESPCLFRHDGRYWLVGSGADGALCLFSSKAIRGSWVREPDPVADHSLSPDGTVRGSSVLPVVSGSHTSYVFMADLWNPDSPNDSRHFWLPLRFSEDGRPLISFNRFLPDVVPVPTEYPGYDVTMRTLLDEMCDVASHSKWTTPSYTCRQASSYSRESKTPSTALEDGVFRPAEGRDWSKGWFENHDFGNFYGRMGNEFILLDATGPGAVVGVWTAYDPSALGTFRFYLDGDTVPVIEGDLLKLAGEEELVSYPFSFRAPGKTDNDVWHGNNLILPIPYAHGCRITYKPYNESLGEGCFLYYQISYRSYEAGTRVKSFDRNTLKEYERDIYHCGAALTGTHDLSDDALRTAKPCMLKAGRRQTLRLKGERCITSLSLKLDAEDQPEALRNTYLSIRFDGEQTVYCPVGAFFGIGRRQLANNTFYVKTTGSGLMTTYWVMPFAREAEVSIVNEGTQEVELKHFRLTSQPSAWDEERSMHFYASFCETKNIDTRTKYDYNYVTIHGRGKYVGDGLTLHNDIGWWGEGDEKVFVDGESFPSHFGTGTEDYYRYAYCRMQLFSFPNISQPIGEGNQSTGMTQDNRYRLLDDIPFTKSFAFYMEIWHTGDCQVDFAPATFWYAFPGCTCEHETE